MRLFVENVRLHLHTDNLMNLSVVLMGLFFTGVIFGPFVYLVARNKRQSNALKAMLLKGAADNHMQVNCSVQLADRILGLDSEAAKLLFFRIQDESVQEMMVDLRDALDCTLNLSPFLIRLDIRMVGMGQEVSVSFMDESDDPFERGNRLPVALEWERRISAVIDSNFIRPLHAA